MKKPFYPKKCLCFLVILLVLLSPLEIVAETGSDASNPQINVLFIGNSLTNRHSLNELFEKIAISKNKKVHAESFTKSGYTLEMLYKENEYKSRFNARVWDYIVLQEGADMPYKSPSSRDQYIRTFDQDIKNAGAKTVLYMHSSFYPSNGKVTLDQQKPVTDAYTQIGQYISGIVVPAGYSWVDSFQNNPGINLYDPDGHPTLGGQYLNACVFYAAFFGESPEGATTENLKGTEFDGYGQILQKTAWESTRKYYSDNPGLEMIHPKPTPSPTPLPAPVPTPAPSTVLVPTTATASTSGKADTTIKSTKYKIDNTKSTISLKTTMISLNTFKAEITLPKNAFMIVLKAGSNTPITSGNVMPGMKVVVIAENQINCRIYTVEK